MSSHQYVDERCVSHTFIASITNSSNHVLIEVLYQEIIGIAIQLNIKLVELKI
jgi:hypothetical protein